MDTQAVTTISDHFGRPICETPHGRLTSSGGRPAFAQCFAHARRAPGQCAKPSPRQGFTHPLRSIFTHWGGVMPCRHVNGSASTTARPPEYAVTAQTAHRKYAAQYARLVRIRVRTGSRFTLRFALLVRTRLREPGANPASGYHAG